MKALVGAFNQEKALLGAFSVFVKTDCETDGALHSTALVLSVFRTGTFPHGGEAWPPSGAAPSRAPGRPAAAVLMTGR